MTSVERHHPQRRGTLACVLFTFLAVLVLAGTAAAVLVKTFELRVEAAAREDMAIVAGRLARSLAQRYERALGYGIPLHELPGIDTHLADALERTPGIAHIALIDSAGQMLGGAGRNDAHQRYAAPVTADGRTLATLEVGVHPKALIDGLSTIWLHAAAAVGAIAVLAATVAGFWAGRAIDHGHRLLDARLAAAAEGRHSGPGWKPHGRDAIAEAFLAIDEGTHRIDQRQLELDAYAAELLAVDFDGQLRPAIEQALRRARQGMPTSEAAG